MVTVVRQLAHITMAHILIICLAVCSLPSLGAFPTDEVAGPSQENAAAALDLLADAERVYTDAHAGGPTAILVSLV